MRSAGRDAEHRDWYVWADPAADGGPPNNWRSTFGGAGVDARRSVGSVLPAQLPAVAARPELVERGRARRRSTRSCGAGSIEASPASGSTSRTPSSRTICCATIRSDRARPARSRRGAPRDLFSMHRPEVHDVLRRWRAIADAYEPPRVLIGETWVRDLPDLARYYGEGEELHMAFNFAFATAPFEARALREVIDATDRALGDRRVAPVDGLQPRHRAARHAVGRRRRGPGSVRAVRAADAARNPGALRRGRDRPPRRRGPRGAPPGRGLGPQGAGAATRAARRWSGTPGPGHGFTEPESSPGCRSVTATRRCPSSAAIRAPSCRGAAGDRAAPRQGGPARGRTGPARRGRTRARVAARNEHHGGCEPVGRTRNGLAARG